MARLWSSGAGLNSATSGVEIQTTTAALTIDTVTVRSGSYSFKDSPSFNGHAISQQIYGGDTAGKIYFRIYARYSVLPSALKNFIEISNNLGTQGLLVRINSSNQLVLLDISNGNAQIGSASAALSVDQWYRVEVLCDAKSGSKTLELYIDGVLVASGSALSLSGIKNLDIGDFTGYTAYYDDLAINDDTGSFQNTYPGAGNIAYIRPSGVGLNTLLTRGGTDTFNNYSQVNEITPDDATTYVFSATSFFHDEYIVSTPAEIGVNDTINAIQMGVRYNGGGASANASFQVVLVDSISLNFQSSASITPSDATWKTNANAAPINYPLTSYTYPGDGSSWTKSKIDNFLQMRLFISSGNTNPVNFSTTWLIVDYTPVVSFPNMPTTSVSNVGYRFDDKVVSY